MEKSIVVVNKELEVNNKKSILGEEDEKFLLDRENPYLAVKNEEKKLLIFRLWEKSHYGFLKNNLLSITEELFSTFIGDVFKDIGGISYLPYNESYFLYIIGEKNGKAYKKERSKLRRLKSEISPSSFVSHGTITTLSNDVHVWVNSTSDSSYAYVRPSDELPVPDAEELQREIRNMSATPLSEMAQLGRAERIAISMQRQQLEREAIQRQEERERALRDAYRRERFDAIVGEEGTI